VTKLKFDRITFPETSWYAATVRVLEVVYGQNMLETTAREYPRSAVVCLEITPEVSANVVKSMAELQPAEFFLGAILYQYLFTAKNQTL